MVSFAARRHASIVSCVLSLTGNVSERYFRCTRNVGLCDRVGADESLDRAGKVPLVFMAELPMKAVVEVRFADSGLCFTEEAKANSHSLECQALYMHFGYLLVSIPLPACRICALGAVGTRHQRTMDGDGGCPGAAAAGRHPRSADWSCHCLEATTRTRRRPVNQSSSGAHWSRALLATARLPVL